MSEDKRKTLWTIKLRNKMEKFNAIEFITKIRNRKFDPSIWVEGYKEDCSHVSKENRRIDYLNGLVNYQANIIDDIMFCLLRMEESKENIIDDSIENATFLLKEGGYLKDEESNLPIFIEEEECQ